jgi:hypothetical protein
MTGLRYFVIASQNELRMILREIHTRASSVGISLLTVHVLGSAMAFGWLLHIHSLGWPLQTLGSPSTSAPLGESKGISIPYSNLARWARAQVSSSPFSITGQCGFLRIFKPPGFISYEAGISLPLSTSLPIWGFYDHLSHGSGCDWGMARTPLSLPPCYLPLFLLRQEKALHNE